MNVAVELILFSSYLSCYMAALWTVFNGFVCLHCTTLSGFPVKHAVLTILSCKKCGWKKKSMYFLGSGFFRRLTLNAPIT